MYIGYAWKGANPVFITVSDDTIGPSVAFVVYE